MAWSWDPSARLKGRTLSPGDGSAEGVWVLVRGAGLGWARARLWLEGTHPCRAGSRKRSTQNWTKALRSVLLMPPTGLMSALEQSYLVR